MFTVADDVTSGEVRNTVGVSAALRSRNGLGARLVPSSPVMVVNGDPLSIMKSVSVS